MAKGNAGLFFDVIYGIRKKILLSFYSISVIIFGGFFITIIGCLLGGSNDKLVLFGMVMFCLILTIAAVVAGSFLSVILELPEIAYDFDKIKNDIASRKIITPQIFSERLVSLLCAYFRFSFFNPCLPFRA